MKAKLNGGGAFGTVGNGLRYYFFMYLLNVLSVLLETTA